MEKKEKHEKKEIQPLKLEDIKTAENKFKFFIKWGWYKIVIYFKPFLRPSFLVCYGLSWMLTNGWTYIAVALGVIYHKPNLVRIVSSWIAFLWLPTTCEGLITLPIALFLHSKLFKNDSKCKKELDRMYKEAKHDAREVMHKVRTKINWYDESKLSARYGKRVGRIEKRKEKISKNIKGIITKGNLKQSLAFVSEKRYEHLTKRAEKLEKQYYDKLFRKNYAKSTYNHYKDVELSEETRNKGENATVKTQNDEVRVNTQRKD